MYRGYIYDPEILEDDDTRRYWHEARDAQGIRIQIGADLSHWRTLTDAEFKACIDKMLDI